MPQGRNECIPWYHPNYRKGAVTLQGSNKPPAMVTGQAVVAYYHKGFGTLLRSQIHIQNVPPSQQRRLSGTLG